LQAAADFNLDLSACVFVGDALTDYLAANAAGCPAILVASGRQGPHLSSLLANYPTVPIVPDLAAAVAMILGDSV
jgi:phosphoglycolate phosphatase-like HAD superfamily hydrolase